MIRTKSIVSTLLTSAMMAFMLIGCQSTPDHTLSPSVAPPTFREQKPQRIKPERSSQQRQERRSDAGNAEESKNSEKRLAKSESTESSSTQISIREKLEQSKTNTIPDLGNRLPTLIYSDQYEMYYSPSSKYDIFFNDSIWFVHHRGNWFRSKSYNGPWEKIEESSLPNKLNLWGQ